MGTVVGFREAQSVVGHRDTEAQGVRGKIDSLGSYWILTALHWSKCLLMAGHSASPALGSRDCWPLKFM